MKSSLERWALDYSIDEIPERLRAMLDLVTLGTVDEDLIRDYITRTQALAANAQSSDEVVGITRTIAGQAELEILFGRVAPGSTSTPEQVRLIHVRAHEHMVRRNALRLSQIKARGQRWSIDGIYEHCGLQTPGGPTSRSDNGHRSVYGPIEGKVSAIIAGERVDLKVRSLSGERRFQILDHYRDGEHLGSPDELNRLIVRWGIYGSFSNDKMTVDEVAEYLGDIDRKGVCRDGVRRLIERGCLHVKRKRVARAEVEESISYRPFKWPSEQIGLLDLLPSDTDEIVAAKRMLMFALAETVLLISGLYRRTSPSPAAIAAQNPLTSAQRTDLSEKGLLDLYDQAVSGLPVESTETGYGPETLNAWGGRDRGAQALNMRHGRYDGREAHKEMTFLLRQVKKDLGGDRKQNLKVRATGEAGEINGRAAMLWLFENQERKTPDATFPGWRHFVGDEEKGDSLFGIIGTAIGNAIIDEAAETKRQKGPSVSADEPTIEAIARAGTPVSSAIKPSLGQTEADSGHDDDVLVALREKTPPDPEDHEDDGEFAPAAGADESVFNSIQISNEKIPVMDATGALIETPEEQKAAERPSTKEETEDEEDAIDDEPPTEPIEAGGLDTQEARDALAEDIKKAWLGEAEDRGAEQDPGADFYNARRRAEISRVGDPHHEGPSRELVRCEFDIGRAFRGAYSKDERPAPSGTLYSRTLATLRKIANKTSESAEKLALFTAFVEGTEETRLARGLQSRPYPGCLPMGEITRSSPHRPSPGSFGNASSREKMDFSFPPTRRGRAEATRPGHQCIICRTWIKPCPMCGPVINMIVRAGGTGAVASAVVEHGFIIGFKLVGKPNCTCHESDWQGGGRKWERGGNLAGDRARNGTYVSHPGYAGDFFPAITCVTATEGTVTALVSDHRVIEFADMLGGRPLNIWRRLERATHRLLGLGANVRLLDPSAGYSGLPIGDIDAKNLPIAPFVIPSCAGSGSKALRAYLVFMLRWFHDYTEPEAADVVRIPADERDAARKYLQRYVKKVCAWLQNTGYPDRRRRTPISVLNYASENGKG